MRGRGDAAAEAAGPCRRQGIGSAGVEARTASHGGMGVPDAGRLKLCEEENTRPRRLPVLSLPDRAALEDLLSRKR